MPMWQAWGYYVNADELAKIAGHRELDYIFKIYDRVFYLAELGVISNHRGKKIGKRLTEIILKALQMRGFQAVVLRTDRQAVPARSLYTKSGFNELPVDDKNHPNRNYWIMQF